MSAPKQLAKRQKLERKRQRKRELSLKRRKKRPSGCYSPDGLGPIGMLTGPVGGLKMSDVLDEFVAPEADSVEDRAEYERLLSMALVAWNAALQPESRRCSMLDDMISTAMPRASLWERQECRKFLDGLVERKLKHFARYHRPILAFQLDELENGEYHLSVVSAVC